MILDERRYDPVLRILLVCARNPWPPRRGDQLRAVQFLEVLARSHEVVALLPEVSFSAKRTSGRVPGPEAAPTLAPGSLRNLEIVTYRRAAGDRFVGMARALAAGDSLQSSLFYSAALGRRLRHLASTADLAIVQLARLGLHLKDLGTLPIFVDLIDSLSLSFQRRAVWDQRWKSPLWRLESSRLARAEARVLRASTAVAVVCERDRRHLRQRLGVSATANLRVLPLVCPRPIPDALSTSGGGAEESSVAPARPTLLLSGNLGYFPNYHGAEWFLTEVWPSLQQRRSLRLVLAGGRPSARLVRLALRQGAEMKDSPLDLFAEIQAADVALAPLFGGAGVPVKVLEAWAAGVPVVASEWAAMGADAVAGRDLLTAAGVEEWVGAIESLIDSPRIRAQLVSNGLEKLRREHTIDVFGESLEQWLDQGLSSRRQAVRVHRL